MGLGNMKEGLDWHRIDPPIQELPEGFGWLYREVVNAPRT